MRESFFERFGSWLAFGLMTLFAWRLISQGLQESEAFTLLLPLHWVKLTPAAHVVEGFLTPFKAAPWWLWAEVGITVATWMAIYFIGRGIFYRILSIEGVSLWVAFMFCIVLAAAFFFILLKPAFDQMEIWRSAWPEGSGQPSL